MDECEFIVQNDELIPNSVINSSQDESIQPIGLSSPEFLSRQTEKSTHSNIEESSSDIISSNNILNHSEDGTSSVLKDSTKNYVEGSSDTYHVSNSHCSEDISLLSSASEKLSSSKENLSPDKNQNSNEDIFV